MKINIKATNMDLTGAISDYIDKCAPKIGKFIKDNTDGVIAYIEVAKTTNHHKQGDFFRAEFNLETNGDKFYAFSEKEDLYKAIDDAKNELIRQIKSKKNRNVTLLKRGGLSVKKMLKGLSKRNPFTSKY